MSCNICHTPILVHPHYLDESVSSVTQMDQLTATFKQACPPAHQHYFRDFVQLDTKWEGLVAQDLMHSGLGMLLSRQYVSSEGFPLAVSQEEIDEEGTTRNSVWELVRDADVV
jgi:hypothetical protein